MGCCKGHKVADPCKTYQKSAPFSFYEHFNTEYIPGAVIMMTKVQE